LPKESKIKVILGIKSEYMKIRGMYRLKSSIQQIRNQFVDGGIILMYHRVIDLPFDPYGICVSPENFAQHLEVIKSKYHPISLQQLVENLRQGKIEKRSVAVTFDDGYADNLENAKPLLEKYEIPATVFITSGNLGKNREFWWDELEKILLQSTQLPPKLNLEIQGEKYQWDLGSSSEYCPQDYHSWNWSQKPAKDPTPRHQVFRSVYQKLQPLLSCDRTEVMNQIIAWSGVSPTPRNSHRSLSPDEVLTLQAGGIVEIGAHTVNHPFLSQLSQPLQKQEIATSKLELEQLLRKEVKSFAYPHGNYNQETLELVEKIGFTSACSTFMNRVESQSPLFSLPRIQVCNWHHQVFSQNLSRWVS
jgi:peptidoglycan/xylan/chitin deacetylase (PgdA/CDA1 family)